ncbi:NAD(P)-dependent dehydrogenase (short-subunit alcohol dehydrogenase family) [Rhizobium leguminosarum]|nr:NAD(P)-dependent dehydrogenase (short-subunit alcohol dehydrogenase family) [Rhizobium leguminosarum]
MSTIEGKVIAITGASSGIGEAAAKVLAAAGAHLVIGARRTERLETLAGEIEAKGGTVRLRKLDVTDRSQVEAFAGFARSEFGRLDVIVNNAGVMPLSPLAALKVDEWDRMVDVNIKGVLYGHRRRPSDHGGAGIRADHQPGFDRRSQRLANGRRLLRDEICGAGDLGRVAAGDRSHPRHHHLAGHHDIGTGRHDHRSDRAGRHEGFQGGHDQP